MSGLTSAGFEARRLADIKADIEARITEAFASPDLRAESVFGQLIGISAELEALVWQLAEDVYGSQYPDMATGVSLDHVVALNGIVRVPARPTQVEAVCSGNPGAELPAGREARNPSTGDVFRTSRAVTLDPVAARSARVELTGTGAGAYSITINGTTYTHTSPGGETEAQILTALSSAVVASGVDRTINVGSLDLSSSDDTAFSAGGGVQLTKAGVAATFFAVLPGATPVPAGALSKIETPVAEWDSVTNPQPGITGADRESDENLRTRRARSISITATNTLTAITSRIRQLGLVSDVAVFENSTSTTDADGTPAHTIWVIAEGGDAVEIAGVIYDTLAAGIGTRGAVSTDVQSPLTGFETTIRFDRPAYVDPAVVVEYTKLAGFPVNGEGLMKAALESRTFKIGESLIWSRLFGILTCDVPSVQIDAITVNAATSNLVAAKDDKIRLLPGNITVTETP